MTSHAAPVLARTTCASAVSTQMATAPARSGQSWCAARIAPLKGRGRRHVSEPPKEIMGDKARGLYDKFIVTRTDGTSEPGRKHDACQYFVLDATHDAFADVALQAYGNACRREYPLLADDITALRMACRLRGEGGPT